jgi:hypothetical protein
MINLPRKAESIVVDIVDGDYEGLQLEMGTLSDAQASSVITGRVKTRGEGADQEIEVQMPYGEMMVLFAEKFIRVVDEDLQIDGEPFDLGNPDHIDSIPLAWKMQAMQEVVQYSTRPISKETRKNSKSPEGSSGVVEPLKV